MVTLTALLLFVALAPPGGALLSGPARIRPDTSVGGSTTKESQLLVSNKEIDVTRNPPNGYYDMQKWSQAFTSQTQEFEYHIASSDVEGCIPPDICGTLFRAMPALFERGGTPYGHYLDGDGYISRVTFSKGKVHYLSKFVETAEFKEERSTDKTLYRSTFRTQRPAKQVLGLFCLNNMFDLKLKNPSNTNIVSWGGQLLALFEAGVPHGIDPNSLETLGTANLGIADLRPGLSLLVPPLQRLSSALHRSLFGCSFTAHPKIDRQRQRMVGWTWRAVLSDLLSTQTSPLLEVYEFDEQMRLVDARPTQVSLKNTQTAPHDFSFTDNYYLFVENRVSGNTLPYVLGTKTAAACVDIDKARPMVLNIARRGGSRGGEQAGADDVLLRVPLSPGFTIHSVCAFEDAAAGTVELYTSGWPDVSAVKGGLLGEWEGAAPRFDLIPNTLLMHTVVCTRSGRLLRHAPAEGLQSVTIEHPHINPLYEGSRARYMYMSLGSTENISSPPVGYMRYDVLTQTRQEWYAPLHTYCEEVVVVPKAAEEGQGEDDVWLLCSAFSATKGRSCVYVFDGREVGGGPVATVWFAHRLPHSLHGCFVQDALYEPVSFQ